MGSIVRSSAPPGDQEAGNDASEKVKNQIPTGVHVTADIGFLHHLGSGKLHDFM